MCPDTEILSAFSDGELAPEWNRRIEKHLTECEKCTQALAGFRRLTGILHSQSLADEEAEQGARIRVWRGIMRRRDKRAYMPPLLRYLKLPLPAFMLVAFLSMGVGALTMSLIEAPVPAVAEGEMPRIPEDVGIHNAEELIRYLQANEHGVNITIQLPDEPHFVVVGKPELLRTAEYRRGE